MRNSSRWRIATAAVALLAAATSTTFAVLVPPYESPDEHAHAEYVRHVAQYGLPRQIPLPDAPERRFVYEWVQPPLYYVLAAPLALAVGSSTPTVLTPDPSSRLLGGDRWVVYSHERPLEPREVAVRLYVLRAFGVLLAVLGVLAAVALTRAATGSMTAALFAGAALALVPQWTAIMASVGNDGLSTTLAALAALSLWSLVSHPNSRTAALAGLLSGAALSTKLTTTSLIPGLVFAVWYSTSKGRGRLAAAALSGFALSGGWPYAWNLVAHGDPFASAFKRAALEAHGCGGAVGVPGVFDPGFWQYFIVMVVEPFWARFGSLGAGLANGSRGWLAYYAITAALAAAILAGSVSAWLRRSDGVEEPEARRCLSRSLVIIAAFGLSVWLAANTVNPVEYLLGVRATMVVHWTPRHLMPLTAPLVAIASLGVLHLTSWIPDRARFFMAALSLIGLSGLWAIVVRDVVTAFR